MFVGGGDRRITQRPFRSRCISHVNVIYTKASPLLFSSFLSSPLLFSSLSSSFLVVSSSQSYQTTLMHPTSLPISRFICPEPVGGRGKPFLSFVYRFIRPPMPSYFILLPASYLIRTSYVYSFIHSLSYPFFSVRFVRFSIRN